MAEKIKKFSSTLRKVLKALKFENIYLNLLQGLTIISVIFGTVVSALGLYGLATGSGVTFIIGSKKPLTIDPVLAGLLTTLMGIILTFEGIYLVKAHFETSRLIFICILFGYLALNIPALLLGLGHSLYAGIFAVIFGYLWLITVLAWLQRGE